MSESTYDARKPRDELLQEGALRVVGVEPLKIHDVGPLIIVHIGKLPDSVSVNAGRLAEIPKWLRKEREFSFYGDVDLIPTEEYSRSDAERAIEDARFTVACVAGLFS